MININENIVTNYKPYQIYFKNIKGIHFDEFSDLQIIYVIEGEIKLEINGEITANPGDLLIINQYENRFIFSDDYDNLSLILNIESNYLKDYDDLLSKTLFTNHIPKEEVDKSLIYDITALYNIELVKENHELKQEKLNTIINILKNNYINNSIYIPNLEEKKGNLKIVDTYINEKSIEKLNLEYLSEQLFLSQSYISRVFKEVAGINFSDFVQLIRLYNACFYLLKTSESIENITEIVEFSSTKSLNRIFGKYLNLKPSEYRNKYKSKDSYHNINERMNEFLSSVSVTNYENFIKNYFEEFKFHHEIDMEKKGEPLYKKWRTIRGFRSLGENYLDNLADFYKIVKANELVVNLKYINNKLILSDIEKEINDNDINILFSKLVEYNIKPIISLKLNEDTLKNKEIMDIFLNAYEQLLDLISAAVGISEIKDYSFLIDIKGVGGYSHNDNMLKKYTDILKGQLDIIKEKIEEDKFNWGLELGRVDDESLRNLEEIYENYYEFDQMPSFLSIVVETKGIKYLDTVDDLGKLRDEIKEVNSKLNLIKGKIFLPEGRILVRDIFRGTDITNIDMKCKNLFMASLMMNGMFNESLNYLPDFIVTDHNQKNNYYYPQIKNEYGFYTPIYLLISFLDQLNGEVILNEPGCLVTRDNDDLYVIVYGNFIMDLVYIDKNSITGSADISLKINNIKGKYKVNTSILNYQHGSILYNIKDFEKVKYMNNEEKKYIEGMSAPDLDINIVDVEDGLIDNIKFSPFNIIFKKYKRV